MLANFKQKVADNFSRAAKDYDANALMQKNIAANLIKLAKPYISDNLKILDVGSGTGFIAQNLSQKIMQSDIAIGMCKQSAKISDSVCADVENLPFKSGYFDIVLSSSSLQWVNSLQNALGEVGRVLSSNGYFIFSTFGTDTLKELKYCYAENNIIPKTLKFNDEFEIKELLENSVFKIISYSDEVIFHEFPSLKHLLRSITDIGAGTSFLNDNTITKENLGAVEKTYMKKFSKQNNLYSSWQVLYFICKKSS